MKSTKTLDVVNIERIKPIWRTGRSFSSSNHHHFFIFVYRDLPFYDKNKAYIAEKLLHAYAKKA
jgi:hypothetical protein